jgi:cysteine dioxygenase
MNPGFTINRVISGLHAIDDADFTCQNVYEYLAEHPIDIASVTRYMFWSPSFYTRNLIYKDERFEVMAICWEKGQASTVHDHSGQKCWMTVPLGRLRGQNFAIESIDESIGYCRLRETDQFELSDCLTAKVELEEPIHQILNEPGFDARAVSIHFYSRPYDKCLSYCRESDTFKEVQLFYTSVDGRLCDGIIL